MNVILLLPNWIGDVVMATPTLRAIRQHFGPEAKIVGVMKPYVAKVLDGTNWLDESIFHQRSSKDPTLRTRDVIRRLKSLGPDLSISFTHSLRTAWMAYSSGAKERIGFSRNGCGLLLTKRLHAPRKQRRYVPRSAIDHYLELATAAGCASPSTRMELATQPDDERRVEQIWARLGLDQTRQVVLLNCGSGSGDGRLWPPEYFAELARRLATKRDAGVLILCGPGNEQQVARRIVADADHPHVVSMADQDLSLGVAKACVKRADLLVSTDSGPRHFGPALDTPVVALFGSIDWRWSDSHHDKSVNLFHHLECAPCDRHSCPLGHRRCMRDLSVNRVLSATIQQLDRWQRQAA